MSGLSADGGTSGSVGTEAAAPAEVEIDVAPLMLAAKVEIESVVASPKKRDGPSPVFEEAEEELEHSPEDVVDTRTAIRSVRAIIPIELNSVLAQANLSLDLRFGHVFRNAHVPESTSTGAAAAAVTTKLLAAPQMKSR